MYNRFTEILLKKRNLLPFMLEWISSRFDPRIDTKIEWKIDGRKEEKIDKSSKIKKFFWRSWHVSVSCCCIEEEDHSSFWTVPVATEWNREKHNCKVQFYLYPYNRSMISFLFLLEKRNVNETCNIANLFRKYKKKKHSKTSNLRRAFFIVEGICMCNTYVLSQSWEKGQRCNIQ